MIPADIVGFGSLQNLHCSRDVVRRDHGVPIDSNNDLPARCSDRSVEPSRGGSRWILDHANQVGLPGKCCRDRRGVVPARPHRQRDVQLSCDSPAPGSD